MENWIDSYSSIINSKLYDIERKKGIIIGFNVSMAFFKTPVMSLIPDYLPREYCLRGRMKLMWVETE